MAIGYSYGMAIGYSYSMAISYGITIVYGYSYGYSYSSMLWAGAFALQLLHSCSKGHRYSYAMATIIAMPPVQPQPWPVPQLQK
jgi:hypothetical protein